MNEPSIGQHVRLVPRDASRVWPMLLRAGGMSVHPGRVVIGMLTCLVMLGVGLLFDSIYRTLFDGVGGGFAEVRFQWRYWLFGAFPMDQVDRAMSGARMPEITDALGLFRLDIASLVLFGMFLAIYSIGSGAMARMVGVDIAADADMSTRHAVRFSMTRWKSLLIAHLVPIGFILGAVVILGLLGKVLLSVAGVSVAGALLQGPAALVGVIVMGVWLALLLGGWMLAPAVVCESTDGVDAIQRCIAYVFKRIGHVILYLTILVGVGLVAFWMIRFIVMGGYDFASAATRQWVSDDRRMTMMHTGDGGRTVTGSIYMFWHWAFELIVSGWLISYISTGATLMYLAMRRVCDDQDPRDLWMEAGRRAPVMPELDDADDASDQDDA